MNQEQLERKIGEAQHDHVTAQGIEARIAHVAYFILPGTAVTICNLRLENGFSVCGESACVDPRNFDQEVGEQLAYRKALDRVWELEGYLMAERRFQSRQQERHAPPEEHD